MLRASTVAICQEIARVVGRYPEGLKTRDIAPFVVDCYRNISVAKSQVCKLLRAGRVANVRVEKVAGRRNMVVYPL
jgi:hypothetical protein